MTKMVSDTWFQIQPVYRGTHYISHKICQNLIRRVQPKVKKVNYMSFQTYESFVHLQNTSYFSLFTQNT